MHTLTTLPPSPPLLRPLQVYNSDPQKDAQKRDIPAAALKVGEQRAATTQDYVTHFKWNTIRYPVKATLRAITETIFKVGVAKGEGEGEG